jgi:YfiH family protein
MEIFVDTHVRARFSLPVSEVDPRFIRLKQVHGAAGFRVPFIENKTELREGDWLWTTERNLPLSISVADCTAILIHGKNSAGAFVAVIHAGWRGTAAHILENALSELKPNAGWTAWLSPSICQAHYEVGEEVVAALGEGVRKFTKPSGEKKYLLDLKDFQKEKLQRLGAKIISSSLCTYCQPEFYSFRQVSQLGLTETTQKKRHMASIELV